MNIESIRKRITLRKANEQKKVAIRSKIRERKDELQDVRIERKETFGPVTLAQKEAKDAITKAQEETKNVIDAKQDELIAKQGETIAGVRGNQQMMREAINALAAYISHMESKGKPSIKQPIPSPPIIAPETPLEETPPPIASPEATDEEEGEEEKTQWIDITDDLPKKYNKIEMNMIKRFGLDPYFTKTTNISKVDGIIDTLKVKRKEETNKSKKGALGRQIQIIEMYKKDASLWNKYFSKMKKGTGVRAYKQPKRNAYKINGGQYGGLLINVPRLMNEMVIEAHKGGQIVYQDKADRSTIDLLTKRFDPKKRYSSIAKQVFNNLNLLSGIPKHRSSGKYGLTGGAIYYSKPEDLMKRLTLITGSRRSGNTSIPLRNEAWEIIDVLLKEGAITREQHDAYVKRHLT